MPTFKVHGLDVWGHVESDPKDCDCTHECDGYQVNDIYPSGGTVEISEDDSDATIVKALVEGDFLTADCTSDSIEVDNNDQLTFYINRKSDGRPLLQLRIEE